MAWGAMGLSEPAQALRARQFFSCSNAREMATTDELLSISSGDYDARMSMDDEEGAYLVEVFQILLKLCVLSNVLQAPLYTQQDLIHLDSIMEDGEVREEPGQLQDEIKLLDSSMAS